MRRVLLPGCLLTTLGLVCLATLALQADEHGGATTRSGIRENSENGSLTTSATTGIDAEPAEPAILDKSPVESFLTPQQSALRDQIRKALAAYHQRPVNARDHTPWEVFHWVIAYNVEAELYTRGPGGEKANAVGWLCYNRPCRGQELLSLENGRVAARYGVGMEGHTGQYLAILGQSRVKANYPLMVGGKQFSVADLVETQKLKCQSGTELTFQLIGLAHYLDLDATWKNSAGEEWSIPRLIREEISKPIHGSACGGTHRLMGLSYAVKKRQQHAQPIDGEYRRAQVYVSDYIQYTLKMQNTDGSFSTEWFSGRGTRTDIDRRVQTTGHILEWMVFASADDQLQDARIVKAVDYLSKLLASDVHRQWPIGPLGHALRSLSLYDRRVFKSADGRAPQRLGSRPSAQPGAFRTTFESVEERKAGDALELLELEAGKSLFLFPIVEPTSSP